MARRPAPRYSLKRNYAPGKWPFFYRVSLLADHAPVGAVAGLPTSARRAKKLPLVEYIETARDAVVADAERSAQQRGSKN